MSKGIASRIAAVCCLLSLCSAAEARSANGEFTWTSVSGAGGCQIVASVKSPGPIIFTSPTKGHRYMFGKGSCPSTVDIGGQIKIYKISGAYPNYDMIKVVETDGTQWWIRPGPGGFKASKRRMPNYADAAM